MGATAATHLHVTTSPIKRSSSTSAMRATLWRQTTSSLPARTASGTVPCRSVVDLHKVFLSKPYVSFRISAHHNLWHYPFFFDHRQGAVFSTGCTGSVNCGFHSQLCGSYPAFSGALCSCTAQTQVLSPQQVRYSYLVNCWFSTHIIQTSFSSLRNKIEANPITVFSAHLQLPVLTCHESSCLHSAFLAVGPSTHSSVS